MIKMYKECYDEFEKCNYDYSKLGNISRKYDITVDKVIEYAKNYYIYVLGNSSDSWDMLVNSKNSIDIINVKELNNLIKNNVNMKKLYEELEVSNCKEFEIKLVKYCYEYCEEVLYDKEMIRNRAVELGLSYRKFIGYAKIYTKIFLGLADFELLDNNFKEVDESKQKAAFTKWRSFSSRRERCYQELGGETYQEFRERLLKCCYEYAKKVGFDRDKIKSLGKVFDLSYSTVFGYIRIYAKQYLGMSNEEYKELLIKKDKDGLDRRITNWINGSFERKKTYECCRGNTYQEFRENLYKMCYNYAESVDFDPTKLREYAETLGISYSTLSLYLNKYVHDVLNFSEDEWSKKRNKVRYDKKLIEWLNKSNKHKELYEWLGGGEYIEIQEKIGEYFYQILSKNNYSYTDTINLTNRWDVPYDRVIYLLVEYGNKHNHELMDITLGIEKIKKERSYEIYKQKDGKISSILKLLESLDDEMVIKELFDGENVRSLYSYVNDYVTVHHRDDSEIVKNEIANSLKNKILNYLKNSRSSSKNEEKEEEYIEASNNMVKIFIHMEDFTRISEFCDKMLLSINSFEDMVMTVKKYNLKLYQEYLNKINRLRNREYAIIINKINMILDGIKSGIVEDDERRQFDLLDYYNITRISFEDMLRIARECMYSDDVRILNQFVNRYKNVRSISFNELLDMKIIINGQRVANDIKFEVLEYLRKRELPINEYTFNLVLKRFMNGKYTVVNGKKLILYEKETYKRK